MVSTLGAGPPWWPLLLYQLRNISILTNPSAKKHTFEPSKNTFFSFPIQSPGQQSINLKFGENNLTKMSLLRHSRLKRRRRVVLRHDLSASDTTCLSGVALAKTGRFPA
jgi:hypothetical protein